MNVNDDISVLKGSKNELIVFENELDTLSFLQLLKLNSQENNRTLITLNSTINTKKFLNRYQNFDGKIFLCLSGNKTGDAATGKILGELQNKNSKDIRLLYGISENGHQNLSEYLQNKLQLQKKNTTLVEPKISKHANDRTQSNRISDTQHLGSEFSERNSGKPIQNS